MARRKTDDGNSTKGAKTNGANLGFEAQMFLAADKLRKNLEPSDYKHVALGLIFLKYISIAFEAKRAALLADDPKTAEDPDEYLAENVFWVPASYRWRLRGWVRVPGEFRFGHLIVMPGRIGDVRANVIVDTGSNATLANVALREQLRLARRPSSKPPTGRGYTAGEPIVVETSVLIPSIRLGRLSANNVVAYIGDFHIFDLLGLQSEPTMLVGMDVLSQSSALAIDYERGVVYLRTRNPPDPSIKVRVVR